MFNKLRSLIFKFDPELAHNLAIKILRYNYVPYNKIPVNNLIETEIFGKKISNPVGLAAGFDKDAEVYNSLFKLGFGFVEVGTITPLKQYGNPKPRVFRLEEDQALINRLGFNNSGANVVSFRIKSSPPNGLFGINIHRATGRAGKKSSQIDKWSAGCQVIADNDDWHCFLDICQQAREIWGNNFTYTLIESIDINE